MVYAYVYNSFKNGIFFVTYVEFCNKSRDTFSGKAIDQHETSNYTSVTYSG